MTKFSVGDIVTTEGHLTERDEGIGIVTHIDTPRYIYLRWVIAPAKDWFYGHKHGDVHFSQECLTKIGHMGDNNETSEG
jgi:hypothetical protein